MMKRPNCSLIASASAFRTCSIWRASLQNGNWTGSRSTRRIALCLDRYDHGRVFFIGDAAHLVPIFGVRGLNSGFADADNLAWKLSAVVRGEAGGRCSPPTHERRAATLEIFREASKSTNYMTPPSRGYRLMRDASLSLSLSQDWAGDLANPRQARPMITPAVRTIPGRRKMWRSWPDPRRLTGAVSQAGRRQLSDGQARGPRDSHPVHSTRNRRSRGSP